MRTLVRSILFVGWLLGAGLAWSHAGKLDANGCHRDTQGRLKHCHNQEKPRDSADVPRAGDEGVFFGPLVRVIDGDSLEARVQGVVMEFRLAEIDAPEYDQPYGREAQREVTALIGASQLVIAPFDTDRYGRTVAHIWAGEVQLNRELVKRGAAWFLSEYARDASLYEVEQEARAAKRGLWAAPSSKLTEPWVWRERKRQQKQEREQQSNGRPADWPTSQPVSQ